MVAVGTDSDDRVNFWRSMSTKWLQEQGNGSKYEAGVTLEGPFVGTDSGRGTTRAEDAQGTPTQSHISLSILVYEGNWVRLGTPFTMQPFTGVPRS